MVLLRVRAAFPAKDTGSGVSEDQKIRKHPLHVPSHGPFQAFQVRRSPENQGPHVPAGMGPVGPRKARASNLPTGVTCNIAFEAPRRPRNAIGLKTGTGSQVCSCVRLRVAQEPRDISESFCNFVNIAFDIDDDTCRMVCVTSKCLWRKFSHKEQTCITSNCSSETTDFINTDKHT